MKFSNHLYFAAQLFCGIKLLFWPECVDRLARHKMNSLPITEANLNEITDRLFVQRKSFCLIQKSGSGKNFAPVTNFSKNPLDDGERATHA